MKYILNSIISFTFFFLSTSCIGQKKGQSDKLIIQNFDKEQKFVIDKVLPINIDTITNFQLLDEVPPSPSYSFYNKIIKAYITITYKGKTKAEQDYWSVYNSKGYFSKYRNVEEPYLLSKEIRRHLIERGIDKYNVTASIIYKKDIEKYYSEDNIKYKPNAKLYWYVFQDNRWKFDKSVKIYEY